MGRPKVSVPAYSQHGPSGQAVVYIDRRRIYLGKHGSPESKLKYGEIIGAYLAGTLDSAAPAESGVTEATGPAFVSVNEVCLKFVTDKLPKYQTSSGDPSAERDCFLSVIRILRTLFGETDAATFGPMKFRKVRDEMIKKGWCRTFINKSCGRVRFIFRLAASWELVPLSVVELLKTVEPLRRGDSVAPESKPRRAVPLEHVEAAKKHLRQRNRDLVDLLLMTAARPGEILGLTTRLIDQAGEIWVADFEKHKTAHHGHFRTLHFGERAQAILVKYLKPLRPDERLFQVQRKTFGTAVKDACVKAGVPPFTPHWLRHTAVTLIADEMDLESAQRVAGHSTAAMTLLYAKAARKKAAEAMKKLG